jgi:hypothetical protein
MRRRCRSGRGLVRGRHRRRQELQERRRRRRKVRRLRRRFPVPSPPVVPRRALPPLAPHPDLSPALTALTAAFVFPPRCGVAAHRQCGGVFKRVCARARAHLPLRGRERKGGRAVGAQWRAARTWNPPLYRARHPHARAYSPPHACGPARARALRAVPRTGPWVHPPHHHHPHHHLPAQARRVQGPCVGY